MGSPDYCGLHCPQLRPAPAWWPTVPKGDVFQHSRNCAHRSITPPCQNRGPAKYERETVRLRPRVGGQRRRRQQPGDPAPGAGRLRAGLRGRGQRGLLEPAGAESPEGALQPGDCLKVAALDRLGRSLTEVLELLGWPRENEVEIISLRESIDQDSAWGGRCCTWPSSSREWISTWPERERWRGWSGSRPLASPWAGAGGSARSGPRRYRACASATAYHGAASPR